MTRYEQGFMNKCAEAGLDIDTTVRLMKEAAFGQDPRWWQRGLAWIGGLRAARAASKQGLKRGTREWGRAVRLGRAAGASLPGRAGEAGIAINGSGSPWLRESAARTMTPGEAKYVTSPVTKRRVRAVGRLNDALFAVDPSGEQWRTWWNLARKKGWVLPSKYVPG